jgi:hypothetical protein
MKTTQNLLTEITTLIREIEADYPELYRYMDENPMTIPGQKQPNVDNQALENYLQTLKDVLKRYKKEV